jgi:hypothetical protein
MAASEGPHFTKSMNTELRATPVRHPQLGLEFALPGKEEAIRFHLN